MRSDAAKNRAAILAAARLLVARDGSDMTMEDLADQAGLAVGTLYRHFPTKTAVVSAILTETLEQLADDVQAAAATVSAGNPAGRVLHTLFQDVAAAFATDRRLKQAAANLGVATDLESMIGTADGPAARASACLETLIGQAQADGDLAAGVTVDDLAMFLTALPDDVAVRARFLDVVWAGLTRPTSEHPSATPEHPLTEHPPTEK